jgi:N-acetylglucosamine transport system substrate-binding protein
MSTSTESRGASRRTFLQRVAISGLAVGPGSAFLASCATAGGGDDEDVPAADPTDGADEGPADADNPLGIDPDGEVEIFIFDGGFGDAYAREIHQPLLLERWPNLTINHDADADVTAALQSRFVAGNPPDFVNNSGGQRMDTGTLAGNGQLMDLTPLYDAPSWDDPNVPVRDTLIPGTIEQGTYDRPYVLNYAYTVFGLWYNRVLFESQGWAPPTTWAEMLELCAEMQGQGIAPWTYPGANAPRYMHWPLFTMAGKLGGPDVMRSVDNLEEGAFLNEAILEAADALAGLRRDGYFLEGSEGLTHIQSQVQWAQGNVGFITCGTWLENEVAASFEDETLIDEHDLDPDAEPEAEFEFAMLPDPLLSDSSAMPPEAVMARPGEPYVVPADAAHPEAGMEYMRAMLSLEGARGFTDMVSSLTSVLGATDGVQLDAPGLASAAEALSAAGENVLNYRYDEWYPAMNNPDLDALTGDLLAGRRTVQEWAEGAEDVTRRIREDDTIEKFSR